MISSRTLKNFVRMHEQKLDAKAGSRRAEKIDTALEETHWGADCLDDRHHRHSSDHWQAMISDKSTRRRPKSRYFNFILTATHQ